MSTHLLSREDLDSYWAAGVLFPQQALSEGEAQILGTTITQLAEELLEDGAEEDVLSFRPWEGDVHPFEAPLEKLVTHPRILGAVQSILGNAVMLGHCDIFLKPHHDISERNVPWKWDLPHVEEGSDKAVTVWVALTTSGPSNGGNQYVTGSHLTPLERGSVDPRHCVMRGDDWDAFRNLPIQEASLEPGQFSLHHPCVIYGSEANAGDTNLGIALRFFSTEAPQEMVGNKSGRPVIGLCEDGKFEPTSNFPIRWWSATDDGFNRNIQKATRLSITMGNSDAQGRVLSRDAMGIIEAIESSIREAQLSCSPSEPGNTLPWECTETGRVIHPQPLCTQNIERMTEESDLRILDSEGRWGLSWEERVDGWRALLDRLVFLGTQEDIPVFELGSHTGPILFRPRRLETLAPEILMDNTPIHAASLDLGIWLAHHAEALESQPWGATFVLPPGLIGDELKTWHRTLFQGMAAADLSDADWGVVLNGSGPIAPQELSEGIDLFNGRVRALWMSETEFAASLFSGGPQKRTLLAKEWDAGGIEGPVKFACSQLLEFGAAKGIPCFLEAREAGVTPITKESHGTVSGDASKPERPGPEGIDIPAALQRVFSLLQGEPSCHNLAAHRAQHINWLRAGVQTSSGERLTPQLYLRILRQCSFANDWSPALVTLWRTWTTSETHTDCSPYQP